MPNLPEKMPTNIRVLGILLGILFICILGIGAYIIIADPQTPMYTIIMIILVILLILDWRYISKHLPTLDD